ncbi:hypothetical protein [Pseudomonas putida]|uniref:Uncharacterized protein n=1 Tax=Pseudomonas putida TaxID=303 RepID=A0A7V8EIW4_PSEPU|nr:hypothetical protein [Pseudomonas putida]KAF0255671.1 hypothetical protein GN299_06160 [Pseudomonas putida]
MNTAVRPKLVLAIALLAVTGAFLWVQHVKTTEVRRVAERDERCAKELVNPPPAFKRSADCATWMGKADSHVGPRI